MNVLIGLLNHTLIWPRLENTQVLLTSSRKIHKKLSLQQRTLFQQYYWESSLSDEESNTHNGYWISSGIYFQLNHSANSYLSQGRTLLAFFWEYKCDTIWLLPSRNLSGPENLPTLSLMKVSSEKVLREKQPLGRSRGFKEERPPGGNRTIFLGRVLFKMALENG